MTSDKNTLVNEFSRLFDLYRVGKLPVRQSIKANAQECQKLADRLDVQTIEVLEGAFTIKYFSRAQGYNVDGEIHATVIQTCVLTSELITQTIVVPIHINYRSGLTDEQLIELDLSSERDIIGFDDPNVDFGEMAVQYLSLHIDPYPKKYTDQTVFKLL